ncbi:MAG TPA: YcnI family protein [Pseudonocardia sp.]|jgi:uncharacterized protein YcnI
MTRPTFDIRAVARTGLAVGAATALTLLTGGVAFAHVTAQSSNAVQGGDATVSFTVPDESEKAGTVKFQVTLPADHPMAEVFTSPAPGWTERITKARVNPPLTSDGETVDQVVRTVTWTAKPGTRIAPGNFGTFSLSMGPLPEGTDKLWLAASQSYDDGTTVNWDQRPAADGTEPEHPAPLLRLAPADGGGTTAAAPTAAAGPIASLTKGTPDTDWTARLLASAGVLLGVLGLGYGLIVGRRSRARARTSGYVPPPRGERRPSGDKASHHARR